MRYETMTGLSHEQLTELAARLARRMDLGGSAGRPYALGLFMSVVLAVFILHTNIRKEIAGAIFGVSQPTVSRRVWDFRTAVTEELDGVIPDPKALNGTGTAISDGTVSPTWDYRTDGNDLFSGKNKYPGINIQIASDPDE